MIGSAGRICRFAAVPTVPGTLVNTVPLAAVCCHCHATDRIPLGSASVPLTARRVAPGTIASGGVIAGAPVTGSCGGAVVAVPVSATDCVLPAVPPELFVATRLADLAPAGAAALNETCTVQLAPGARLVVHVVGPRTKLAASVPVRLNRVAAVN